MEKKRKRRQKKYVDKSLGAIDNVRYALSKGMFFHFEVGFCCLPESNRRQPGNNFFHITAGCHNQLDHQGGDFFHIYLCFILLYEST